MESAFGVDHGWVSKAREYKRDAEGKFAPMTDQEYEDETDSIGSDIGQMHRAETDAEAHAHWHKQVKIGADYLRSRGEHETADDFDSFADESLSRHKKKMARMKREAARRKKVSKGIPKGLPAAAGKNRYALLRLRAHNKGKLGFEGGKKPRQAARKILQSSEENRGRLP
jgi:hypothetical protein